MCLIVHDGVQHFCFLEGYTHVDPEGISIAHFPLCKNVTFLISTLPNVRSLLAMFHLC